MQNYNKKIDRAANLLENAFKITKFLKASSTNSPHIGVMMSTLENYLKEMNKIIRTQLEKKSLEESKIWDYLDVFLKMLLDFCFWIILNIILHCKYFLLKQKLKIYLL